MPMNASVKYFSSAMANAPQLSATPGSLIAVLDACLVNGFNVTSVDSLVVADGVVTANISAGHPFVKHQVIAVAGASPSGLNAEHRVTNVTTTTVQFEVSGIANGTATGTISMKTPPLKWVKPFAGTNKGAYRIDPALHPDSPTHHIKFDESTSTYNARVTGFESMTGIDSGAGAFPSGGQAPSGLWVFKTFTSTTTNYRPWFIIGDSRFFYIGVAHYLDSNYDLGITWSAFGEFESVRESNAHDFVLCANWTTDSVSSSEAAYSVASTRENSQYFPRSYDDFNGSVAAVSRSWPSNYGASGGSGPIAFPNGPNNGLYLCKLNLMETSPTTGALQYRGDCPGMYMLPHNAQRRIVPDRVTPLFDMSISGFEGKVVGFFACNYSSSAYGVVAFDLTGPWGH